MHKAKVIEVSHAADGLLAVRVRCCDDPLSESVLTLGSLHRSNDAIDADIQAHLSQVEKLHESRSRAAEHIQRLLNDNHREPDSGTDQG